MDQLGIIDYYHVPHVCKQCGGVMIYEGVGEYRCENCNFVDYDDYGKVRRYIESHRGATAAEIELVLGISQRTIRQMLRDSRLEVAEGSKLFLHCEICGKEIRSGRYCSECEIKLHRNFEAQQREKLRKETKGYGMYQDGEEGQKRFIRNN